MSEPTRCKAVKPNGDRCRITTRLSEDGLCMWHDPARAEKAANARFNGGVATGRRHRRTVDPDQTPGPLKTMADAARWASWCVESVATGTIDVKTAREITGALREFRGGLEKAELAGRLKAIEAKLAEYRAES